MDIFVLFFNQYFSCSRFVHLLQFLSAPTSLEFLILTELFAFHMLLLSSHIILAFENYQRRDWMLI